MAGTASPQNVPLISFNGGEIGLEAMARVDVEVYPTCAETMENILPLLGGGMIKAPGTEVCDETPGSAIARVLPFVFDVDDSFVLELSAHQIRLDYQGGTVLIDGAPATIAAPVDNGSTGAATITAAGTDASFACQFGLSARARWQITTASPSVEVSLRFEITKRPLKVKIGVTTTGDEIQSEQYLAPGVHIRTFAPGAGTYYLEAQLDDAGGAELKNITALPSGDLTIPTPYAADDLALIKWEHEFDNYWLFHPDYQTRVLQRWGDTSWSLIYYEPSDGPFLDENADTLNLVTPNAYRGTVTLSAVKDTWTTRDIGRIMQLRQRGQADQVTMVGSGQATDSILVAAFSLYVTITGTWTGTLTLQYSENGVTNWQPEGTSWTANVSATLTPTTGRYYRVAATSIASGSPSVVIQNSSSETLGTIKIIGVTDAKHVTGEILSRVMANVETNEFALGEWSDDLGWPVSGALFDGRLALVRDDRFWESTTDDPDSQYLGSEDADAISKRLAISRAGKARWIAPGERLIIGTIGTEVEIRSTALDEAITPTNVNARSLNEQRGASWAQPVVANKRVLFINRFKTRIYEAYLQEGGTHAVSDLTEMHKKIGGVGGFLELAYQEEPEPRLWGVRADGQLATLLYRPKQQVAGWARMTPAGTAAAFESVCVIPGATEDRVYVIARRTINGVVKRFREILSLQEWQDQADACRLQCASFYEGAPTMTIAGLDHLEGETVSVWANGRVHADCVVESGQITLNWATTKAYIGLNYLGRWKPTVLAYGAQLGTALAQPKRIGGLGAMILNTPISAFGWARTFDDEAIERGIPEFEDNMPMDSPLPLVSGTFNLSFDGATDIDSRICIIMDKPAPVQILALAPSLETHEYIR